MEAKTSIRTLSEWRTVLKFCLVGISNTVLDWMVFKLLFEWMGVHVLLAYAFGYAAGTLNSYFFNRLWTFRSGQRFFSRELGRFLLSNLIVFICSYLPFSFCTNILALSGFEAKQVTTLFTLGFGFLLNRSWVFVSTNK